MATTSNLPPKERPKERLGTRPPGRSRLSRPQLPAHPRRKLAGRSAIAALVLLSAITGSLAGLTLVYSVNLPQIQDLEHYRPSTTTDLYDRKGRIIGSFALERREVVGYDGFAPVLRQAVISIEDKNFESHWGINVFRVAGAAWHDIRSHGRAQGASTLTMQLARNLFLSSDRTADAQDSGSLPRHPDRARLHQGADLHALRQPDLSGQRHVRLRGRLGVFLLKARQRPHAD